MKITISLLLIICLSSRCSTTNQSEPEKVKGISNQYQIIFQTGFITVSGRGNMRTMQIPLHSEFDFVPPNERQGMPCLYEFE